MTSRAVESPVAGKGVRASWGAAVAERANECADAIDAMRGPGALGSLRERRDAAGPRPFGCRAYRKDASDTSDERGKFGWMVYLPPGCLSVGGPCEPFAAEMRTLPGFGGVAPRWYKLDIRENEHPASETDSEGGQTVRSRTFFLVTARAKTSAKVWGVDELTADARRLLHVSARWVPNAGAAEPTAAELAQDTWGDEFAQTVGRICIERDYVAGTYRRWYEAYVSAPVSVAGRPRANFDLVWYLGFRDSGYWAGQLEVRRVYCERIEQAAAGMTLVGPDYVDVTDADSAIYARIDTNGAGENVLDVVMDPSGTSGGGDLVTWLHLYDISNNAVKADYRASSLVNVQVFR